MEAVRCWSEPQILAYEYSYPNMTYEKELLISNNIILESLVVSKGPEFKIHFSLEDDEHMVNTRF